jgi:hypothetical protein
MKDLNTGELAAGIEVKSLLRGAQDELRALAAKELVTNSLPLVSGTITIMTNNH